MTDAKRLAPLVDLNRIIKENRVAEYSSCNLALGMLPIEFGSGTSRWEWRDQPLGALNPFGTIQGGYLTVFVDELFSTAIASILEDGEWAVTAEIKVTFPTAESRAPGGAGDSIETKPRAGLPRGPSTGRARPGRR